MSKSLISKDSSESDVDNISSNIRHSFKNMSFENNVSVLNNEKKNPGNGEFHSQPIPNCNECNLNWSIPANVLKDKCDMFLPYLTEIRLFKLRVYPMN